MWLQVVQEVVELFDCIACCCCAGLTQMLDYYAGNSYDDGDTVTPRNGGARSSTIQVRGQSSSRWTGSVRAVSHVQSLHPSGPGSCTSERDCHCRCVSCAVCDR